MARKVKSWIDQQRDQRKLWSETIKKHSPAFKSELAQHEKDYAGIDAVFADPKSFEAPIPLITEYMDTLRDIRHGIELEKRELKALLKEKPKGKPKGKGKAETVTGIVRPVKARPYTDPTTGETLYIVDSVKGLGDNVAGVTFDIHAVRTSAVDEKKAAHWSALAAQAVEAKKLAMTAARKAADANKLLEERKAITAGKKAAEAAKTLQEKANFYAGIRYRFNVTKRGRKIEQRPGEPRLYDHPDEKRLFKKEDDAILRARRVIHGALIWYEARRKKGRQVEAEEREAKELKKIRKATKARIKPRPKARRQAEELWVGRETEVEKRARQRKKGTKKPSGKRPVSVWETEPEGELKKHRLVQRGSYEHLTLGLKPGTPIKTPGGARKGRAPAEVPKPRLKPSGKLPAGERRFIEAEISPTGKFRMPKKPKGNPLFGGGSGPEEQAKQALANFNEEISSWQRSMKMGRPNGHALVRAYDWLENARANYSLAEMKQKARQVQSQKAEVRDAMVALMEEEGGGLSFNPENPSATTHLKIGSKFLAQSEKEWDKYCKSLKVKDLLDAYQSLIVAERELGYAKDKKGVAQAKAGLKAARAELSVHKKKSTKKKTSKKKTSKKKAK